MQEVLQKLKFLFTIRFVSVVFCIEWNGTWSTILYKN